jgi:hypothetical protein
MEASRQAVLLMESEITFLLESLGYTAKRFRDYDYSPADPAWAAEHRGEKQAIIDSIRHALKSAKPVS